MNKRNLLALACILPLVIQTPVRSEYSDELFSLPDSQANQSCSDITAIGNFSYGRNEQSSKELLSKIIQLSEIICSEIGDNDSTFDWGNGRRAKTSDGNWYYPNRRRAKTSDGNWYYSRGRIAKTSDGNWYYPSGRRAKTSDGNWYHPSGRFSSSSTFPTRLFSWACIKVGKEICDRRKQLILKLQESNDSYNESRREFYLNQSLIMLAWYAYRQ
ncbi:hypothetical protein [Acaryochloris marina]|uniref:hypothetical protein n=1 Tax=Acaryochloris marina TaxID=155978 RepID=UPI0021C490F3|nr:hypothetical protein [Acaryochloris marina]BDM83779.1 hypothetical protein AM10699_66400 [Acaryochloris marina MBIC10699]